MNYQGRIIDAVALWSKYVEFPGNMDESGPFLSLVKCPNPEHDTNKRHFQINISQPTVHCFAECGISGSYEHALAVIHGYYADVKVGDSKDEREKRKRIKQGRRKARREILQHSRIGRNGSARSRKPNGSVSELALPEIPEVIRYLPQAALDYLESRGVSGESIAKWELAWNPRELRIAIPVHDQRGVLRFYIERATRERDWPKYLYPKGAPTDRVIFGHRHLDLSVVRSEGIILVEGSLDTIRMHQHGLVNTGSVLGARIHKPQADLIQRLRPKKVFLFFDRDATGASAILYAKNSLPKLPLFVCRYPKGKSDPAELSKREAYRAIARAVPYSRFTEALTLFENSRRMNYVG